MILGIYATLGVFLLWPRVIQRRIEASHGESPVNGAIYTVISITSVVRIRGPSPFSSCSHDDRITSHPVGRLAIGPVP